ncbi:MAG: gluconate 2-dehydrogenase subunit 3 family protein [Dehalococcoidia bacterium]
MTSVNQVFTEQQRQLLTAALNRLIPAEGEFPGAGDLGLAAFVERAVSRETGLTRLFIDGLAQIEIAAGRQGSSPFTELSPENQVATLKDVEAQFPDFFTTLVRQCYNGYYTNPDVFELIGYSLPLPEDYQPKPFDESLLEPQRQRAPFWRQV